MNEKNNIYEIVFGKTIIYFCKTNMYIVFSA